MYAIKNSNGTLSQATVTVRITGVNDLVSIVSGSTDADGAVAEDSASPTLSDTGTIAFTDPDLIDTHTAIATAAGGNTLGGTLTLGSVSEADDTADGSVGWTYEVANAVTQYLAADQTATESFDVAISDAHGSTAHQTVTVTVTGINDDVTIVDGSTTATGDVTEDDAATLSDSGTIAFTDPDLIDTHTVTYTASLGNTLGGTLSFDPVTESPTTAEGSVGWTYSVNNLNAAVQALGAGVQAIETFDVEIDDGQGSTANQTVTVTVTGVNDDATIAVVDTDSAEFTEDDGGPYTASGQLQVNDVDTGENVFEAVAPAALNGTYGTFTFNSATGEWGYTLDNDGAAVQALTSADTVTDTLTVSSLDGTDSHDITITINGADEAPTLVEASLPLTHTGGGDPSDNADSPIVSATLVGTNGDDVGINALVGTASNDKIYGRGGNDSISGGDGDDTIYGGNGDDNPLNGDAGIDTIYGNSGNDTIFGGSEGDTIFGGSGNDTIHAGGGADIVRGGFGADTIDLGLSDGASDTLVYGDLRDTNDIISNFVSGEDKIDLSAIDANSGIIGNQAFAWADDLGGQHVQANSVSWHASGGNVHVYADTDGDVSTAEFHITLQGITSVLQTDFIL